MSRPAVAARDAPLRRLPSTRMASLFGVQRHAFVFGSETPHNNCMTLDEFAKLRPGDRVECAGLEYRVIQNQGHALSLRRGDELHSVAKEQAGTVSLVQRLSPQERRVYAEWDAVAPHLRLVNLVRARIGQRPLSPQSGYTPADVKADAEFYASTQSWARQRAGELGVV